MGALQKILTWLLGTSWKSTLLGFVQALANCTIAISTIPNNLAPDSLKNHWPSVIGYCLIVKAIASSISGRLTVEK